MEDNKYSTFITNEEMRGIDMNLVQSMQLKDGTIIYITNGTENENENQSIQLRARPIPKGMIRHNKSKSNVPMIPLQLPPKTLVHRGPQRGVMPIYNNGPILRGKIANIKPAIPDKNANLPQPIPIPRRMPGQPFIIMPPLSRPPSVPQSITSNPNSIPPYGWPKTVYRARPQFNEEENDFEENEYQCDEEENVCDECRRKIHN